jgi:N-formylmaleamate deformylase
MKHSHLILAASLGLAACAAPAPTEAAPPVRFEPTRFSVQVQGEGPDVILIPGLTAGRDVWAASVRAVPGYRYHLIQVAGFAGDPARGNAQGAVVAPLAEEVARYIEANRLQRPAIVGHSMGGTVAMMVGARRPQAVGRIMVVDMLPQPAGLFGGTASGLGPLADSLRDIASTPGGRRLFEGFLGQRGSDTDVVARAMHELATTDLGADLPRIRAPMTVLYAAPDARTRARNELAYADAYRAVQGARLVPIEGSGHMIMFDQPQRFHSELRAFLR